MVIFCFLIVVLGSQAAQAQFDPSVQDYAFYEQKCQATTTSRAQRKCTELLYSYPTCVPWFVDRCDTTTKKQCVEFNCEVILFQLFYHQFTGQMQKSFAGFPLQRLLLLPFLYLAIL